MFYDRQTRDEVETTQVRPFYWKQEGPEGKKVNILSPLIRYREDHVFRRLHVFPNIYYTARHSPADQRSWFLMVFPILFVGHDDLLVLPIGGYSRGFLGFDRFLMITPLYIRTKRFSRDPKNPSTYTIHSILWPFIAWGSDGQPNGRRKFKIAPFYGRTVNRDKRSGFILWPFYTWRRDKDSWAKFFFPFYGREVTPTRKTTTIMFPIYRRSEDLLTGGKDVAVFPFWRRAWGSDEREIYRYWPFYQYSRSSFTTTEFVAWPFWRRQYVDDGRQFAKLTWVAPPFYKRIRSFDRKTGKSGRKTVVWPIGRFERYPDGGSEVAIPVLSPLEGRSIREAGAPWRPFISLYHKRRWKDGGKDTTALFGLYQVRRRAKWKKARVLFGLVGWERDPKGRYLRLLWGIRLRVSKRP